MKMLLAYDAGGNVVATLSYMVARDDQGEVIGLIDFEAHEDAGDRLREIWTVESAVGSGTWPEWLHGGAHDFQVEVDVEDIDLPDGTTAQRRGKITALVHKVSGHRRERAKIEKAIAAVKPDEKGQRDIRHLVGGPGKPLLLDDRGRTKKREAVVRPNLPLIGVSPDRSPARSR